MAIDVFTFKSNDTGAPTLTGQAGSLIALLDAVLLAAGGYNSRTITGITRSGTTATATTSVAHGYQPGQVVQNAGADQADYNGKFRILAVTSTTFDFTVANSPATPATGASMTAKVAPVGNWSKAFSGTNKAAYQSGNAQATGFYLRFDDTGTPGAQGNRIAWARGYESMTDIDNGLGLFPTVAALANGYAWRKSSTADATARPWVVIATETCFWLMVSWIATNPLAAATIYEPYFFGDLASSRKAGDAYHCLLSGLVSDASSVIGNYNDLLYSVSAIANLTGATYAPTMARAYSGAGTPSSTGGGAVRAGLVGDGSMIGSITGTFGSTGMTGLDPVIGGYNISPVDVTESGSLRGRMPLLFHLGHVAPYANQAIDTGFSGYEGRTFMALKTASQTGSSSSGQALFDITGPAA